MSYTLYGSRRSGSLAVEMALAEIGAAYTVEEVSLGTDAQRDDAYAAVNPQRKLPALRTPGDETLTESLAILLTLDERHPEAGLLPAAATPARARALRWLCFMATEIYPLVEINDYPGRFAPQGDAADALRGRVRAKWRERWLILESQVEGAPWLLAEGFSACDLYAAVLSRWAQQQAWVAAELPRVEAITRAVAARPAAGAVWQRHRPDEAPAYLPD